jgi:DNA-binding NtrC family response regulator
MSMRRPHVRPKHPAVQVSLTEFGWDPAVIATLRHCTLPWCEDAGETLRIEGTPFTECATRGTRDRLSILGQYAAHLAFLKFAGIADSSFRPEDWMVVFRRNEDCRLVRVRAQRSESDEDAELSLVQSAASVLAAPALPIFKQSWGKTEHVYHEIDRLLRNESRADISWFRRSATGSVRTPGAEGLLAIAAGQSLFTGEEHSCADSLRAWSALSGRTAPVVLGGPSTTPLQSYSAVSPLISGEPAMLTAKPAGVAEHLFARGGERVICIVQNVDAFDGASRELLQMLLPESTHFAWVIEGPPEVEPLAIRAGAAHASPTRWFVLSPRVGFLNDVQARLAAVPHPEREGWLDRWVRGEAFARFLDGGQIAAAPSIEALRSLPEPRRSYLAAISLIGPDVDRKIAEKLLTELGSALPLAVVAADPVAKLTADRVTFPDPAAHEALREQVPAQSRPSLCRLAASLLAANGDALNAARLSCAAEDHARACEVLEIIDWEAVGWRKAVNDLGEFPETLFRQSELLSEVYARALLSAGRYRRAAAVADSLPASLSQYLRAVAERRLGNYAGALDLLHGISRLSFEKLLLEGELLRLSGEHALAQEAFGQCGQFAETDLQKCELGFQRSLLAFDREETPDPSWLSIAGDAGRYYAHRYEAYRSLAAREYDTAAAGADAALEAALDVPQRIDAAMDVMEAAFLAGEWDEARHFARQALLLVEETEGDRAAGGILFLLAYLCADEGQWQQAARKIERLRDFYGATHDAHRLREIDLLESHLALGRGDLETAGNRARMILSANFSSEIREAAALVLDEIAWMHGRPDALHSTGASACVELQQRHLVQRSRRGGAAVEALSNPFLRSLVEWETGAKDEAVDARTVSQRLQLLRACVARARSRGDSAARERAAALCRELDVPAKVLDAVPAAQPELKELRFLQEAALLQYPADPGPIAGLEWRYAARNRIGQWQEIGSASPMSGPALDGVLERGAPGWMRVGEQALLYVEGFDSWSEASRRTAAEFFRLRFENHNLRRALGQEEDAVAETPEMVSPGIIGQCAAVRELLGVVARVARRDVPITILGESGTGKELVARAVHSESPRRGKPFTAVNCAALPEHLVESELFGHVRGAFTGADRDHAGLIESTDGGTLFLDEIGEMPLATQAKLLRFLQDGEFRRVGDSRSRTADVRIVAATNRKLEQFVDDGRFRIDLYYRICGVELKVPALRERGADIIVLARHFLTAERAKHRAGPERFAPEVEQVLAAYSWPGNVRELQNTIRAAHAMAGNLREIDLEHLPERLRGVMVNRMPSGTYFEELTRFRKSLVERSLEQAQGNQNQAAKLLGMSRQALAYQIRELGIMVKPPR